VANRISLQQSELPLHSHPVPSSRSQPLRRRRAAQPSRLQPLLRWIKGSRTTLLDFQ